MKERLDQCKNSVAWPKRIAQSRPLLLRAGSAIYYGRHKTMAIYYKYSKLENQSTIKGHGRKIQIEVREW